MNYLLILLLSFIVGTSYYSMMESTIPNESNCSFVASIWTDLFAFLAGFILIYKGIEHDDNIIVYLGGTVIVEHIWQLFPKYTLKKMMNKNYKTIV